MKVRELWARASQLLSGEAEPEEIRATLAAITARLTEIGDRQQAIGESGRERLRVLSEGEPGDLVALDEEVRALDAEERQLRHRSGELDKRWKQARAERGIRKADAYRKDLAEAVEAAEAEYAAYQEALGEAERAAQAIRENFFAAREIDHADAERCFADVETATRLGRMVEPENLERRADYLRELSPAAAKRARIEARDRLFPGRTRARAGGDVFGSGRVTGKQMG